MCDVLCYPRTPQRVCAPPASRRYANGDRYEGRWQDDEVWQDGSTIAALRETAAPPRYIIEHVATVERTENAYQIDDPYAFVATDRVQVFLITALGIGATEHARVMLQTTYGRVMD